MVFSATFNNIKLTWSGYLEKMPHKKKHKTTDHKAIHNILSLIGFARMDFSENYWRCDVKFISRKTYQ